MNHEQILKRIKWLTWLFIAGLCLFCGLAGVCCSRLHRNIRTSESIKPAIKVSTQISVPSLSERKQLSDAARLRCLERLGKVPPDADSTDWRLASDTTWWGKPVDRTNFWKGRVIWCDMSARVAASAHGRAYPPIPYDDETLARLYPSIVRIIRKDANTYWYEAGGLDTSGSSRGPAYTSEERGFWYVFLRTQPQPPDVLKTEQVFFEEDNLSYRKSVNDMSTDRLAMQRVTEVLEARRKAKIDFGYPREAFSDDALFWEYVLEERKQYESVLARSGDPNRSDVKLFLDTVLVDHKLATDPLTDEQLNAANAWKIAYLKRLRNEKVDESYVDAYLKAWNLLPAQLSETTPP